MDDPESHPQKHVQTTLIREFGKTIEKFRSAEWEATYIDVIGALEYVKQNVLIEYAQKLRDEADEEDEDQST